ncbi:hypothetical protein MASR1M31_10310 [Porphyromonadaceae bacterium]
MVIEAPANSAENKYIKLMTVNGKTYTKNYIDHATIMAGGTIRFEMSSTPNKSRGVTEADVPYSFSVHEKK